MLTLDFSQATFTGFIRFLPLNRTIQQMRGDICGIVNILVSFPIEWHQAAANSSFVLFKELFRQVSLIIALIRLRLVGNEKLCYETALPVPGSKCAKAGVALTWLWLNASSSRKQDGLRVHHISCSRCLSCNVSFILHLLLPKQTSLRVHERHAYISLVKLLSHYSTVLLNILRVFHDSNVNISFCTHFCATFNLFDAGATTGADLKRFGINKVLESLIEAVFLLTYLCPKKGRFAYGRNCFQKRNTQLSAEVSRAQRAMIRFQWLSC